jgi:hypothetical protein
MSRWQDPIVGAHLDTPTNDGRANLPVCPYLTAGKRSDAGGTMGIRTPEHRSARSGGSLGGAAAPPYLGGGVKLRPIAGKGNRATTGAVSRISIRYFVHKRRVSRPAFLYVL